VAFSNTTTVPISDIPYFIFSIPHYPTQDKNRKRDTNRMEFLSLLLLVSTTLCAHGFTTSYANKKSFSHLFAVQNPQTSLEPGIISVEKYNHKDWELTYLFKEAAPGRENDSPIILVHPVGVGISSWFYTRLMTEFTDNPPIYAPDLIGCGLAHGADAWDPEVKGMFFPLSWTEGVETLIDTIALPRWREKQIVLGSSFGKPDSSTGCIVLVQGGLVSCNILNKSCSRLCSGFL